MKDDPEYKALADAIATAYNSTALSWAMRESGDFVVVLESGMKTVTPASQQANFLAIDDTAKKSQAPAVPPKKAKAAASSPRPKRR